MDGIMEDKDVLFPAVFKHLDELQTGKPFDEELLKRAERALDASCPQPLLWKLLTTGETLLKSLQQDPSPLTRLLERCVLLIPFDQLKAVISAEKLIEGLISLSEAVQLLCLAYLKKASDIPSGASFVACSADLVYTLVTLWLSSGSTKVSERCLEDIIALLAVDSPNTITVVASEPGASRAMGEAEGQGLFWRRIFQDPDIYTLLFEWTSLKRSSHDLGNKKGQQAVTISQARLFDFIARVASLDWAAVTTTKIPDIEREYSNSSGAIEQPYGGLLKYAANGMIDSNDLLMEVLRHEFFGKLLQVIEEEHPKGVSSRAMKAIQDEAGVQSENGGANGMHL